MKYIKKIILQNFQSHKYSELEFSNSLNIIVGASDSGKTSILRAIKWVLYNEPLGDYFIRKGSEEVSVTLVFNDETEVTRYRGKSKNQYILTINGESSIYEGFGSSVPEEIIIATGIKKINLDQNQSRSINLSEQLDGPFLLSEKGSTKAASIGRLVGANIIDDALKDTLSDIRRLKLKKSDYIGQNEGLKEEIKTFTYLDELQEKLEKLKVYLDKLKYFEERKTRLLKLKESYNYIHKEIQYYENRLLKLDNIDLSNKFIVDIEDKLPLLRKAINYKSKLKTIKSSLDINIKTHDSLKDINNVSTSIIEIEYKIKKLEKINDLNLYFNKLQLDIASSLKTRENFKLLEESEEYFDRLSSQIDLYNNIKEIYMKYIEISKRINIGQAYLKEFNKIDSIDLMHLNQLSERLRRLSELNLYYGSIYQSLLKGNQYMNNLKLEIDKKLKEYIDLLYKGEVCPYCQSKITIDHVNDIVKNYMKELSE